MSYFVQFPYLLYPNFSDPTGNTFSLLKNITVRVIRKISPTDDKSLYYKYTIKEGETIESISNTVYDSPIYYWVLMLINERYDRFYDFPLNYGEFENYITDKYGSISAAQTTYKYYIREAYERYSEDGDEDDSFFIEVPQIDYDFINPDSDPQVSRPITQSGRIMKKTKSFYDYEFILNEEKRNILILNEEYLQSFVKTFNALVE